MLKQKILLVFFLLTLTLENGCLEQDPVTGRSHLYLVSASSLNSLSARQYAEILKKRNLSSDPAATALLKRVGERIKDAVSRYCQVEGISEQIKDYKWEFSLIEGKEVNAFAMPGGKVAVYTGILKITRDETGLAVVLGHEISHVIAQHSRERMSKALLLSFGGIALGQAMQEKNSKTKAIFLSLYGLGSSFGIMLPNSRRFEYEADKLGLEFMAMAGYDPRAAVPLWKRMQAESKKRPPEFMSTHPAAQNRIKQIQNLLPEAIEIYKRNKNKSVASHPLQTNPGNTFLTTSQRQKKLTDIEQAKLENEILRRKLGLKVK